MFVARISFQIHTSERDHVADLVNDLLACWFKNGQVVDERWPVADRGERLEAIVRTAEQTSLEPMHNNVYAGEALAKLLPVVPVVELVAPEPGSLSACACSTSSARVLFTNYLSADPPVRCLDCFGAVPLYRLPYVHDEEHLVLLQWAADYRACDTLQMHCTTGERFGERELSEPDSSLSRNGRGLCAELERLTGLPVYYYLHKTRSRSRASELSRTCPSCNGPWRLERPLHGFDFRCDSCRLVSAIAADAS